MALPRPGPEPRATARRRPSATLRAAAGAAALLALASPPARAADPSVLVLDTSTQGRPLGTLLNGAFRQALEESARGRVSIYDESLDAERFSGADYFALVRRFLEEKYRARPPRLVVAWGDPAVRFALDWKDAPWPTPAVVFMATTPATVRAARLSGRAAGLSVTIDAEGSLRAALALLPDTEEVALVASGDAYLPVTEKALATLPPRIRVTRLVDLPLDETRRRIAALPRRSFVYYTQVSVDRGTNRGLFGRQGLTELAKDAPRPFFGHTGTYLGYGLVGGSLVQPEVLGREAAELAARILAGEAPAAISVGTSRGNRLMFDDRELRRWHLDAARLPPESEVRFRAPTLWEEHRGTVIGATGLVLVEAGLIAALAAAVRRRRAAQKQLRRLSGRILTAQEEERSRIARELHDGASQQLALLAIELDQLGACAPAPESPAPARALAGRAREISRELHHIAYELHPAILDQLGLVPALRQFASQLAARHGIGLEVSESDWPGELPAGVALALYRVAQEALQNAAKHSGAGGARVSLRGSPEGVALVVSDAGSGFDPATTPSAASLGLAGMRERLRLVGGALAVESRPGAGTSVTATVPAEALRRDDGTGDPGTVAERRQGS